MKSFIINACRLGFVGYARLLLRYNCFYLLPGFCITSKKGFDRFVDFELFFLMFSIGFRFIILSKRK